VKSTVEAEALAQRITPIMARVLKRFAGKPFSTAVRRRMEIAVGHAIAHEPDLEPLREFEAVIMAGEPGGPPRIFFVPRQKIPAPANDRA
jgi:hypothetical protein